jgi:hypothetical protein
MTVARDMVHFLVVLAAPDAPGGNGWSPVAIISLILSGGALAAVGGLILLPRTRRKIISDTGVSDATQAKMYSEMGMTALKAALEEAKSEVERLKEQLKEVSASAELERRLSNARINQLLDDGRSYEGRIRQLELEIIRSGGTVPPPAN